MKAGYLSYEYGGGCSIKLSTISLTSFIHQPAVSGDDKFLNKTMWRQLYGVAVWMVLSTFITIY